MGALSGATACAGTFTDDFSGGLNPANWTLTQTTPGMYSVDTTQGDVRFAKVGTNPGGLQRVSAQLNMAAIGGSVSGDFSLGIDMRDAVIGSTAWDQIELHAFFNGGYFFFNVYDNSSGTNVHVWDGGVHGTTPTALTAGRLEISRVGSTLSAFFNGALIHSTTHSAALDDLEFVLQNNNGSNDDIRVTFDNFSITGGSVVPEPATVAALGLGLVAILRRRRG